MDVDTEAFAYLESWGKGHRSPPKIVHFLASLHYRVNILCWLSNGLFFKIQI